MTWSTPNKSLEALVLVAALGASQVAHSFCDMPGSAAEEFAAADATAELSSSACAERFTDGLDDAGVNAGAAADVGSLRFGPSTMTPEPASISAGEELSREATSSEASRDDRLLVLDMTVNGTHRGSALILVDARGTLYAEAETLANWGMVAPYPPAVTHAGRKFHGFDALPGVLTQVVTSTMSASARIPPEYLNGVTRSLSLNSRVEPEADLGAFLDYSLAYADDPGLAARQASGLFSPTLFTPRGNFSSQLLYRELDTTQAPGGETFTRLETTWTTDFPGKLSSLRVGDALTPAGSWSRSLRFGGIQLATNFATQPTLITFPQPSISGSAVVPTALDIFVNGSLRSSQDVPDGTFRINDIPVVTGAGQIQVVTRDLMGREQLVVQDFYTSNDLLRPGLSDYSLSIGALRENYGLSSNDYSDMLVSAMLRRGLSDVLTVEGRFDATGEVQVASGAATYSMTRLGAFSAALAVSNDEDTGALWQLGHQYQGREYRFDVRLQGASKQFAQPGIDLPGAFPRMQSLVSAGTNVGGLGSFGMSFIDERFHNPDLDRKVVSLSYSTNLPADFSLNVSGSYIQREDSEMQASLVVMKYFGGRRSASSNIQRTADSSSLRVEYRDDAPTGPGFGYRAAAFAGESDQFEAETTWNTRYNRLQAEVRSRDGQTGFRAQADGSVAWLGGDVYANREIRDGFAVVDTGGYEGVSIYLENREMGVTDSTGRLMIPGLLPYQANQITMDSGDLPLTAAVTKTKEAVAPYFRSGLLVEFDVRDTRGVLLQVNWPDGTPVTEGSMAKIAGRDEAFPVGRNGRLYLQGVSAGTEIVLGNSNWQCRLTIKALPGAEAGGIPNLGSFVCIKEISAQRPVGVEEKQ